MKLSKPLSDGRYCAKRKEASLLAAVAAGHSLVFPEAELVISDGWPRFYKDGKEVWSCNAQYAAVHFYVERL